MENNKAQSTEEVTFKQIANNFKQNMADLHFNEEQTVELARVVVGGVSAFFVSLAMNHYKIELPKGIKFIPPEALIKELKSVPKH